MKRIPLFMTMLLVVFLLMQGVALASSDTLALENADMGLLSMTGGIELSDFALYDANGVTSPCLVGNSQMSIEVLIKNTQTTSRNYSVMAVVYSDNGVMHDCAVENGRFDGTQITIDQQQEYGWVKRVNLKISVPELTENTELKVMLFESPQRLKPSGKKYFSANMHGAFKNEDNLKLDLEFPDTDRWEGIVESVPYVDYANNGYSPLDTPMINLNGNYKFVNYEGIEEYYYSGNVPTGDIDCSLVDVSGLLGKKVVAYIGKDEDPNTGNKMVYAIAEKSNGNKVTSISSTQLVDADDKEYTLPNQISYRNVGATKIYNLDITNATRFFVNYENVSPSEFRTTADLAAELIDGGTIDLVSNNNDDKVEYVIINKYISEETIKSIKETDGFYSFSMYNGDLDDINTEDEDKLVIIYKDGKLADAAALAEGDTVSTVEIGSDVRVLYASSRRVIGSVTSYDTMDKTVTIGGVDYELSPFKTYDVSSLKDETGTFYLNINGQIAHNESDSAASGNYGLILAVGYNNSGVSEGYVAQVVMQDGTVAEYNLSTKAKFYDRNGSYTGTEDDDSVASKLAELGAGAYAGTAVNRTYKTQVKYAENMVFKVTIKNNEITKIKTLTGEDVDYLSDNAKKYDAEAMSYGNAEFDEDTVVFAVDSEYGHVNDTEIEYDEVAVGKVSDFFTDENEGLTLIALDEDNGICGAVLGFDLCADVPEKSAPVIISSVKNVSYDDSDAVRIFGMRAGEEVTYIIYDDDDCYTGGYPEDLAKGDVILVGTPNAENVVNDYKLLYTANKDGDRGIVAPTALAGNEKDEICNQVGMLHTYATKNSSSKFFIDANVGYTGDEDAFAASYEGIAMKSSANYTLVDYTENAYNPVITKQSAASALSTSSKHITCVFVRVYGGVLTEVVAYRFNNDEPMNLQHSEAVFITEAEDGDFYIRTTNDDTYGMLNENCTYTGTDGINQGAASVFELLQIPIGMDKAAARNYVYSVTAEEKDITAIRKLAPSGTLTAGECTFSQVDYCVGTLKFTGNTSFVKVVYSSDGKVTAVTPSSAEELFAGEGCDMDYYTENGAVKLVVGYVAQDPLNYALVTAIGYNNSGINEGYEVQAVMQDGTVAVYDLSAKAKFYDEDGYCEGTGDDAVATMLALMATDSGVIRVDRTYMTQARNAKDMVFYLTIKDNEITKIKKISGDSINYLNPNAHKYNAAGMTYGAAVFDECTVMFALSLSYDAASTQEISAEDVLVGSVSKFMSDEMSGYTLVALDGQPTAFGAAVGYDMAVSAADNSKAIIVTAASEEYYDGNHATRVFGLQDGKSVNLVIYNEKDNYSWNNYPDLLKNGDVILVSETNEDGVAADFKLLYNSKYRRELPSNSGEGSPTYGVFNASGSLDASKTTATAFYMDTDVENADSTFATASEGIAISPDAQYTLVDYTGDEWAVVSKSTAADVFSAAVSYDSDIFVRVCDNKLTDVVVYRYNSDGSENYTNSFTGFLMNVKDQGDWCEIEITEEYGSEYYEIASDCVYSDNTGKISGNLDAIRARLEASLQNGSVYSVTHDEDWCIKEMTALECGGSLMHGAYTYSMEKYMLNQIPLYADTKFVLVTKKNSGKITSVECSSAGEVLSGSNDISYYVEDGKIKAVVGWKKPDEYAFVTAVGYNNSGVSDGYVVQVAMQDGTVAEYDLSTKAKFYDAGGYSTEFDDESVAAKLASMATGTNVGSVYGAYKTQVRFAKNMVFKVTIKNDEITKIKTLTGENVDYLNGNAKKYDAEAMSYGAAEFDEDTVVFAVEPAYSSTSTTEIEYDEVAVGNVSDFFADEDEGLTFIALDEDNGTCGAVLGFDLNESVSEDSAAVIISYVKNVTFDDSDATQITGIQAGEEVTYIIYDDDDNYTGGDPEDLAKGDVILAGDANAENVVNDYKLLYTANKNGRGIVAPTALAGNEKDEISNQVGLLDIAATKNSSSKFFINANVGYAEDEDAFAPSSDGITMKSAANYTLVDYTESTKNPTISKQNAVTALSTNSRYTTYVFVRVYDGVLTEVVAYRFMADF